jgi:hypothetical protein
MESIPVDRDLAVADAEEPPEVDHRGAHMTGSIDHHVDDPPHVLSGAAADPKSQHGHDVLLIEHRCDSFGGGGNGCLFPRGFRGLGELQPRRELLTVISGGCRGRAERQGRDNDCRTGDMAHEPCP